MTLLICLVFGSVGIMGFVYPLLFFITLPIAAFSFLFNNVDVFPWIVEYRLVPALRVLQFVLVAAAITFGPLVFVTLFVFPLFSVIYFFVYEFKFYRENSTFLHRKDWVLRLLAFLVVVFYIVPPFWMEALNVDFDSFWDFWPYPIALVVPSAMLFLRRRRQLASQPMG